MTTDEREWEALAEAWSAAAPEAASTALEAASAPLARIVRRHRVRLVAAAASEAGVLLGAAALSAWVLRDGLAGWEAAWLATLWAFAAIAAGFAWWNRRGTWAPIGGGVAEYARLTRLRCRRQRRSIRFALALFAAEAAAVVALLAGFDRLTPVSGALLALSAAAVAAWCFATERRVARELAAVEEFERDASLAE
ncbi:MAG TPA: hypothetical protein VF121_06885 [Thermoanaerobaculia bacterium]|nr:hypothetical protein [Thermoanaerobaculia bacterium]